MSRLSWLAVAFWACIVVAVLGVAIFFVEALP